MIFSRLQLPQTLAALVFEIIQGKAKKKKKKPRLSTGTF